MDNFNKDKRVIVIQGEILALLHDIGKLNWEFYYYASDKKLLDDIKPSQQDNDNRCNLSAIHTLNFLDNYFLSESCSAGEERTELQNLLKKKMKGWNDCNGVFATDLSALLISHHFPGSAKSHFTIAQKFWSAYLIMYADTSDSLFSKGDFQSSETKKGITLSNIFGTANTPIIQNQVESDTNDLAEDIMAWIKKQHDKGVIVWDDDKEKNGEISYQTLCEAKDSLSEILKKHTVDSPAETRPPNNDVTLWQHSRSTASIFKALLAEYLYSRNWNSLLQKGELCHAKQKLSLLGIRWNEDAFLSKSLRSHEIVGRELVLNALREDIRRYVENDLALGNVIYEDRSGICFLVPDMQNPGDDIKGIIQSLVAKMEELSNGQDFDGTLPWRIEHAETGLRIVSFDDFWNQGAGAALIAAGPHSPKWIEKAAEKQMQICPRCGFHVLPGKLQINRIGSSSDGGCSFCNALSKNGWSYLEHIKKEDTLFGITAETKIFRLPYGNDNPDKQYVTGSRFALIQGFIPREILCSGNFFQEVLKNDTEWEKDIEQVKEHWRKLRDADPSTELNKNEAEYFINLLGASKDRFAQFKKDGAVKDGWSSRTACSPPPQGKYSAGLAKEYIRFLVLNDKELKEIDDKELEAEAEAILLWGKGQFAAPSRLMRLWETMDEFFKIPFSGEFKRKDGEIIPISPLSRDSNSFRLVVNSADALPFIRTLREEYDRRIGPLRHNIPLHVSAAVFRKGSPIYIAMDSARRFANIPVKTEEWIIKSKSADNPDETIIEWNTPSGRKETWKMPAGDPFRGWFRTKREKSFIPIHIKELQEGDICRIMPSAFDYEVLDSSIRRYDIRYDADGKRKHYMSAFAAPRPYSLGILDEWRELEPILSKVPASQLKTCQELLCRIHFDWKDQYKNPDQRDTFERFVDDILINTLGNAYTESGKKEDIRKAAVDGSLFDLCEWMTLLNKQVNNKENS